MGKQTVPSSHFSPRVYRAPDLLVEVDGLVLLDLEEAEVSGGVAHGEHGAVRPPHHRGHHARALRAALLGGRHWRGAGPVTAGAKQEGPKMPISPTFIKTI